MKGFGSDNHSGVHPVIFDSLTKANVDHAPSYGTDNHSRKAETLFQEHFGREAKVYFVFNGTAANVLCLRSLVKPYQSVFCSDVSHLQVDECGAPEFFFGGKLNPLPSAQGKITLAQIKENFIRRGDQHFAQAKAISLTQPTELGTVYSINEIKEIVTWAKQQGLFVHIDGARLANACIKLNCNFQQMTSDLGVDIVSFGGTKNGLMMGEAIVVLNPKLNEDFQYLRKQSAQLPSKTRFIACQFEAYLQNSLWKEIASHSVQMAERLHVGLKKLDLEIVAPQESNAVFVKFPKEWIKILREKYFFYVWDEKTWACRIMTTWDTTNNDVDGFLQMIGSLK